ncbi:MAG: DUF447 family protein [Thermoplasmata archaeon]
MVHREGILVSRDGWTNTAAMGADIDDDLIRFRIFRPSDTAENLKKNKQFTFSLTDDPIIFYKAALTGYNSPQPELREEELIHRDIFYYPKKATRVFFCEVSSTREVSTRDDYGTADILEVKAVVLDTQGDGPYIDRDDPLVDAMVHATRYAIATGERKKELEERIEGLLDDLESPIARRIKEWMEAHS